MATGSTRRSQALEEANTALEGVVQHIDFTRKVGQSSISDKKLRDLIVHFSKYRLRNEDFEFPDLLGAAYEYLVGEFADSAGKKGGEFYTPRSVVRMMVRLIEPREGMRIYDPCSGSGGMLILSKEYVEEHGGNCPESRPLWPGEQRRGLVHLEDEPAPPRHPRRGHSQRRHARRTASHRGRRVDAFRPGDHQSAVLAQLHEGRHSVPRAIPVRVVP